MNKLTAIYRLIRSTQFYVFTEKNGINKGDLFVYSNLQESFMLDINNDLTFRSNELSKKLEDSK